MSQSSLELAEDRDSLFGSLPPSPARGRSPSPETLVTGGETGPAGVPGVRTGKKNVGTIALPGSHMSCAELPADLPAPSSRPVSSHDSSSVGTPSSLHSPVAASQSSTHSVPSRASPTRSMGPSASTKKRRRSKPRSSTQITSPPVTLPGPNEPTPPNFLRSQSSLLGLAGVVGCVKPAQLRTHDPKPALVPQRCSPTQICGSTPTHPIVIDDDQDAYATHTGRCPVGQVQVPQHLGQLDSELFRSNITSSLTKEKNLFPVLESLIKLLGGEPQLHRADPPPQPFARPYEHGIFNTQLSSSTTSLPVPGGSTTANFPPLKRRKLKHVPAGAVDWDVPFPFAAGEGPKAYRDTWAQDRTKQLLTQLLELVQNAAKRAAIKTVRTREKVCKGRTPGQSSQSSRSASVETQIGQGDLMKSNVRQSPSYTNLDMETSATGTSMESLSHYLGLLETPSTGGSAACGFKDGMPVDLECAAEENSSAVPCDYSAFEEWLSQLQQFLPPEANISLESDWDTRLLASLDAATSNPAPDILYPTELAIQDEAIDPALLAISQQLGLVPQSHSSTSTVMTGGVPQSPDIPPALAHSPRTSLSSLTEPPTPHSETFADIPTSIVAHQGLVHDPYIHQAVENECPQSRNQVQSYFVTESAEHPLITTARKGKARADVSVASAMPTMSTQSTPSVVSITKGVLDRQAILEHAQERRKQLIAEMERTKIEIWETTIENAVLVHFTKEGSL